MRVLEFIVREAGGDRVIPFPSKHFCIGSGVGCDLVFDASLVRPRHAEVFYESDSWFIRDVAGSNSVLVNGLRTLEGPIDDGAQVTVGRLELTVCIPAPPTSPRRRGDEVDPTHTSGKLPGAVDDATEVSTSSPKRVGLVAGDVIDRRYRIVSRIAAGGMGEVYRAEHVELGKPVAVKVMLADLSGDTEFVARFKREAIAASGIGQQNIVDISDFGRTGDGRFYFVMELVDGRTLAKHLRVDGAFAPSRVVHIGLQVARALAAAHARGIIHRDLKPENVMLVQRPGDPDFVKVLDFGVAKVTNASGSGGHTAIGMIVGTPQYMAPEQAAGLGVDARSDVYALGLILHELLSGRPTFAADTPPALMHLQMAADPPPFEVPVPAALESLVFEMLAKSPEQRPPSMQEVVERLEDVLSTAPTPARTLAPRPAAELKTAPLAAVVETRQSPSLVPVMLTGYEPAARTVSGESPLLDHTLPGDAVGAVRTNLQGAVRAPTPQRGTVLEEGVRAQLAHERPTDPDRDVDLSVIRPSRTPAVILGLLTLAAVGAGIAYLVWPQEVELAPLLTEADAGAVAVAAASAAGGLLTDAEADAGRPMVPDAGEAVGARDPGPASEPPRAAEVKLVLTTSPAGAQVLEGGVVLGTTPLTLTRAAGQLAHLKVELAGYRSATRKFRFDADNAIAIELERQSQLAPPKRPPRPPKTPKPDPGLKSNPYDDEGLKDLPD